MDTIEKIEKDFNDAVDIDKLDIEYDYILYIRILIQIAYQLRVLAQKGVE